jgi:hypothetical protein
LSNGKVTRFLDTPIAEWQGEFSPDGKWMAYVAKESSNQGVYLRSFPGGELNRKISTAGGNHPAWSPSGDRLFYEANGSIMAADLEFVGKDLRAGNPVALFSLPVDRGSRDMGVGGNGPLMGPGLRVRRDGSFLVEMSPAEQRSGSIVVTVNWRPQGTKGP